MGNNRFQWPTVHKSWKVSIFNYSGTPSGAGRASNKDLVGGKHRTIRKNKGWSCSSAKPHYEDAHWSTGLGRWQFGPTHPSSRTSYAGKRKKKNIRELPIVSQPFPTFFWHFHTFSHLMPIHLGPRHCSKTRLRNASDLSIMLSKPQPILQDIWLWVKTLVPWVPSNSWDVNSPKCIVRVQIFLFFVFLFFSLGHFFLLFATFWSRNTYFAEFRS